MNPIGALKLFLSAYAFERQGSAPFYKELSVEALEELSRASLCSASFREICGTNSTNTFKIVAENQIKRSTPYGRDVAQTIGMMWSL